MSANISNITLQPSIESITTVSSAYTNPTTLSNNTLLPITWNTTEDYTTAISLTNTTKFLTTPTRFIKVMSNLTETREILRTSIVTAFNTKSSNVTPNSMSSLFTHAPTNATEMIPEISINDFYIVFIFNGLLSLFGILGNIFVCLIIFRGRKMYTIANLFLMNLALADMLILMVSYPLWVMKTISPYTWPFGEIGCKLIPSISDSFYGVSLGCMMAISLHRYRMILHSFQKQLTFLQSKVIILVIWIISLATISTPLFWVIKFTKNEKIIINFDGNITMNHTITQKYCYSIWPTRTYERIYQIFLIIFWYILPLKTILFTFIRINWYLREQMRYKWIRNSERSLIVSRQILGIKKALQLLAPVVVIFAVLMLPWNIIRVISIVMDIQKIEHIQIYIVFAGTMLITNSVVNPFIYYIISKEFRVGFRKQISYLKKLVGIKTDFDTYSLSENRRSCHRVESLLMEKGTATTSFSESQKFSKYKYSEDDAYHNNSLTIEDTSQIMKQGSLKKLHKITEEEHVKRTVLSAISKENDETFL